MPSVGAIATLTLLAFAGSLSAEEAPTTSTTSTAAPTTTTTTTTSLEGPSSDKIARRIIDDRLMPPRSTEFSHWHMRLPAAAGEVHRPNVHPQPPRVTEDIDDNVSDRGVPKKTRTVGPTQETGCCGGTKSVGPTGLGDDKDKSAQETLDLERGGGAPAGPAARFHGNRPSDDRYGGHGWRTSSYLGFGKDKDYYDRRYPYDRYGPAQRPSSNYAIDGDRYTAQRPGSSYSDSDRYGSGTNSRPGYQSSNYGYLGGAGGPGDRPRPGVGGNYGISGNVADGDTDYPFGEGGPPSGGPPSNLQTQKAVALKALAGVALIGAAAALASNPVLLPISVISGRRRRKRSTAGAVEVQSDNYALTALLQGYIQPKPREVGQEAPGKAQNGTTTPTPTAQELVISPECVARLACHVHRDYLDELEKSKAELSAAGAADGDTSAEVGADDSALHGLEHWFDSLIHSNILAADYLSDELKSLIRSAVTVGSNKNATCDTFSCLNVHDTTNKKTN